MKNPSVKNVSTSDLEAAFTEALIRLTGWHAGSVKIQTVNFGSTGSSMGEDVQITLEARFHAPLDKSVPF